MDKIRIGIIGTGIIARAHYEGIIKNKESILTAICDTEAEQMERFCTEMKVEGCRRFVNYRELVESGLVDAVLICTPPVSHCQIAVYAAEHKIHVFCEKPIAMNKEEAELMEKAAKENQIVAMVGFAFRYIPAVQYIKGLIDEGSLGKLRMFRGAFYANRLAPEDHPLEWRHQEELAGSGVLSDLGSHVIDLAHYFFFNYSEIDAITASSSIVIPERINPKNGKMEKVTTDETLFADIQLKNGISILLENTRYAPFEMSFMITGSKGAVKYNMMDYAAVEEMFYEKEGVYSQKYSQVYQKKILEKPDAGEGRFVRQFSEFISCISEKRTPENNFSDGLENQKFIDDVKAIIMPKLFK